MDKDCSWENARGRGLTIHCTRPRLRRAFPHRNAARNPPIAAGSYLPESGSAFDLKAAQVYTCGN
jgi:hypothetical protein